MEQVITEVLNVTLLAPPQRHPAVFERFETVLPGESMVLLNDHDPKPLYYQMLAELGQVFNWQYLEQGPQWWRVRITRRAAGEMEETIGHMVASDYRKAQVFKKYGLDFCCGGKKTLKEACAEKGLDTLKIEQELATAREFPSGRALNYDDWKPDFLADFIEETHHAYVRKTLPQLLELGQKVWAAHGKDHPELDEIWQLLQEVETEMSTHMIKEERVLFPFIRALVNASEGIAPLQQAHFGTVQHPIQMMEMEHEFVGAHLARIRELTNEYILPEDACNSYRVLYGMLQDFENDLHLHVHLENNILFPRALTLESNISLN
ncbi:MAG TPA: iron-sulfur cluster repair di-iron protein [Phnomibacter sp.]|nr:iron-sulfur cluster repair di-iron protein [Phnomibacter sp.]